MENKLNINLFPKAHFWLLIPFALTIAGFYLSYWSRFSDAPWRQHIHGLSATAWYILVVLQPWLIHNKPLKYHKKLGVIGVFLAGAVVFSAFQVIPYQVVNDFLPNVLKYGFSFGDICALIGFSICVILGVLNAKKTNVHARWLISTVFWILLPATARLVYFPLLGAYEGNPPLSYLQVVHLCWFVTTLIPLLYLIYLDHKKEKKVYNSYLFTLIGVSFYTLAIGIVGKWQWWIDFCHAVIGKGM
ncbi:hypothetical protein [Aegicerativicinus sediminis]|uniref:hypothetical protein n=1 Tax=Aegicerativicinus sediminis TaxID=2893202 RepID=UPI001E5E2320|nr:hypothetical protein [Aegicerativicinus sediminis]